MLGRASPSHATFMSSWIVFPVCVPETMVWCPTDVMVCLQCGRAVVANPSNSSGRMVVLPYWSDLGAMYPKVLGDQSMLHFWIILFSRAAKVAWYSGYSRCTSAHSQMMYPPPMFVSSFFPCSSCVVCFKR